jgi:hypothetical protein
MKEEIREAHLQVEGRPGVEGRTTIDPKPWWQVGLAILLGVMVLVDTNLDNFGWQIRLPWPVALSVLILLPVSSLVWAVARRRWLDVGAWGLVPLGLLAFMGVWAVPISPISLRPRPLGAVLLLVLDYGLFLAALRVMFGRWPLVRITPAIGCTLVLALVALLLPVCISLVGWGGIERYIPGQPVERSADWGSFELYAKLFLLVVVGVFLAKDQGLTAGLFVLAGGVLMMDWHIEQVNYFWDQRAWGTALEFGVTVLFFIVAPTWVLRSRAVLDQAAGLLVPALAYVSLLVSALSIARGFPVGQSISIASPAMVLCAALGAAIVLYAWMSSYVRSPVQGP